MPTPRAARSCCSHDDPGPAWPGGDVDVALRELSRLYIPGRHPDANPSGRPSDHYGSEDAGRAIELAGGVLTAVEAIWVGLPREPE